MINIFLDLTKKCKVEENKNIVLEKFINVFDIPFRSYLMFNGWQILIDVQQIIVTCPHIFMGSVAQ